MPGHSPSIDLLVRTSRRPPALGLTDCRSRLRLGIKPRAAFPGLPQAYVATAAPAPLRWFDTCPRRPATEFHIFINILLQYICPGLEPGSGPDRSGRGALGMARLRSRPSGGWEPSRWMKRRRVPVAAERRSYLRYGWKAVVRFTSLNGQDAESTRLGASRLVPPRGEAKRQTSR